MHRGVVAPGGDRWTQGGEQLHYGQVAPERPHGHEPGRQTRCGDSHLCLGLSSPCLPVSLAAGHGVEPKRVPWLCTKQGEAIIIADGAKRIIATNRAFSVLSGYSEAEMLGRDALLLKSGRESRVLELSIRRSLSLDGYWQGELWGRRRDGSFYPKWLRLSVVRNLAGEIVIYIARFYDISDGGRGAN